MFLHCCRAERTDCVAAAVVVVRWEAPLPPAVSMDPGSDSSLDKTVAVAGPCSGMDSMSIGFPSGTARHRSRSPCGYC